MKPYTRVPLAFTQRQLDWLEKMFPEIVGDATTGHADFLVQSGKRIVVKTIMEHIQKDRP